MSINGRQRDSSPTRTPAQRSRGESTFRASQGGDCTTDSQCPNCHSCVGPPGMRTCQLTEECASDSDCASGEECENCECVEQQVEDCYNDSDCGPEQECQGLPGQRECVHVGGDDGDGGGDDGSNGGDDGSDGGDGGDGGDDGGDGGDWSGSGSCADLANTTVPVGEQVSGCDPGSRWVNVVDSTRLTTQEGRPPRGSMTTVEAEFTNRIEQPVSISEPVYVDGQNVGTMDLSLGPGEERVGEFDVQVPFDADSFTIEIAGNDVTRDTDAPVSGEGTWTPRDPAPGTDATVEFDITNHAAQVVSGTWDVDVNGTVVDQQQVSVPANGSTTVSLTVPVPDESVVDVDFGPHLHSGTTTGSDTGGGSPGPGNGGEPSVEIQSTNVSVSGTTATATYQIRNAGDGAGTRGIEFAVDKLDNGIVNERKSREHTIQAGSTASGEFTFDLSDVAAGEDVSFCPSIF